MYHDVCPMVESTILGRPNASDGLNEFLDAMERLHEAQIYFEKNNPQSVELENVVCLMVSMGPYYLYYSVSSPSLSLPY